MAGRMRSATIAILLGLCGANSVAAPFADPTQPPGALAGGAADAAPAEGPRLQSILISPNRRVAVIGGRTVPLGGNYGDARVVRITETEVVLQTGQERQSLRLHPEVEKRERRQSATKRTTAKGAVK